MNNFIVKFAFYNYYSQIDYNRELSKKKELVNFLI